MLSICTILFKVTPIFGLFILDYNVVDWNQFNTSSNPVPTETSAKYGRINHFWIINPLKSQYKS